MIEIEVFEGDTARWTFSLKRGGTAVDLANATAVLDAPYLGIVAGAMTVDGSADTVTYAPTAGNTQGRTGYHIEAFITVTFVTGKTETYSCVITVRPKTLWERVSPTTSTSTTTSTSSSTSTTTTL